MSAGIRALLEQISELKWAVKQAMELPDDFNMNDAWEDYVEMLLDPTWQTDHTSAPMNFYDYLQDCKS